MTDPPALVAHPDPSPAARLALHLGLVLSGFAALVYETSWTRMLHRVFGVGDLAVAAVLAAFFLGLGLGSWIAAQASARMTRPARTYVALEVLIAIYAGVSPWLVPLAGQAYAAVGADAGLLALSAWRLALSLAILLPPTLLMGATLPVLARLVAGPTSWSHGVTGLYFSNTLGAVLGAGLSGLVLVPQLGARISTWIAAAASLAAAAVVGLTFRRAVLAPSASASASASDSNENFSQRRKDATGGSDSETSSDSDSDSDSDSASDSESAPSSRSAPTSAAAPASVTLALVFAGGAGMASLAGEVLWTRALRMVVSGTTQAFASMLACYLLGIALGALIARRLGASRLGAAAWLGITQVLVACLTVLAMAGFPHLVRVLPILTGALVFTPHEPVTVLFFAAVLLLPLALVLGTGLPLAWRLAEAAERDAARGSGRVLAANTVGALAGALGAGFFLVPAIGIEASLLAVTFLHLVLAGLALRLATAGRAPALRALALTAPLALGVISLLSQPSLELPFLLRASQEPVRAIVEGPNESWRETLVFLEEGRSTTVTVQRRPHVLTLYNDGRPESGYGIREPGFGVELALLGSLPALFAGERGDAMAIGLGAGHTTTVLLGGGFAHVDVVELEEQVVHAARMMHETHDAPFPLDDPRATLIVDDARNRLALVTPGRYDAVVSQPSHPWLAGSSALYTREFFLEVRRALAEDGVFALWVNLFRIEVPQLQAVVRTLREVFPHVMGFVAERTSLVFAASAHPPDWGPALETRLATVTERFLAPWGIRDRARLAAVLEMDSSAASRFAGTGPSIVDDRPVLEFELAALPPDQFVPLADLDRALGSSPWWSAAFAAPLSEELATTALIARVEQSTARPVALARVAASLDHAGLSAGARHFVDGVLAEARGDMPRALDAWTRSDVPAARTRAGVLAMAESRPERALAVLEDEATRPDRATPFLRAALEDDLRAGPGAERAVALARALDRPDERALTAFVEAEREEPCRPWRSDPAAVRELAREHGEVAFVAEGCAFAAGDPIAARELGTLAVRARRAAAEGALGAAEACRVGGNAGCARMLFTRAIRLYPANSRAAIGLAMVHHAEGQRERATAVLLEALHETRGIAPSQAALAGAAAELGLDVGVQAPRDTESPTSAAPTVNEDR